MVQGEVTQYDIMAKLESVVILFLLISTVFALPERIKRSPGNGFKGDGSVKAVAGKGANNDSSDSDSSSSESKGCDLKKNDSCSDSDEDTKGNNGKGNGNKKF